MTTYTRVLTSPLRYRTFRFQWGQVGTLWTPDQEEELERLIRQDIEEEFGRFREPAPKSFETAAGFPYSFEDERYFQEKQAKEKQRPAREREAKRRQERCYREKIQRLIEEEARERKRREEIEDALSRSK